jgi:hypothetical protein
MKPVQEGRIGTVCFVRKEQSGVLLLDQTISH